MKHHDKPYKCRKCGGTTYIVQGVNRQSGKPHRRCAECRPKYVANWKYVNRDQLLAVERQRKERNERKIRAATAAYGASHPERWAEHSKKRKEMIQKGSLTTAEVYQIAKRDNNLCIYCSIFVETKCNRSGLIGFDHLIGLLDGGEHAMWNLAVCCLNCNTDKGRMSFAEYVVKMDLPREWFDKLPERVRTYER